jgi:hypothetical protein
VAGYGLKELLAELESDAATRRTELDTMRQAIERAVGENDEKLAAALRRSFVLLAYAHAEGGVRYALEAYVRLINDRKMSVEECNPNLVASAWGDLFRELADTGPKAGKHFRGDPGDDPKLHVYARRAGFVSSARKLEKERVEIPDKVVNTESNIDQVVLSKLLFQLGLPRDWDWDRAFGDLVFLKNLRNKIAHGEIAPVLPDQCSKAEAAALDALGNLRRYLERSVIEKSFLRGNEMHIA